MKLQLGKYQKILLIILLGIATVYLLAPAVYERCSAEYQERFYGLLYNVYTLWVAPGIIFAFISSVLWYKLSRRSFIAYIAYTIIWTLLILILLSIVLASLNAARMSSRDARRLSDIKQLQLALELYFDGFESMEGKDFYPERLDKLAPKIIPQVPKDPLGAEYTYRVSGDRKSYVIGAVLGEGRYGDDCYTKVRGRMPGTLRSDVDGEVLGVQCNDPVYCLTPKPELVK